MKVKCTIKEKWKVLYYIKGSVHNHFIIQALHKHSHSPAAAGDALQGGRLGRSGVAAASHVALSVSRGNGAKGILSFHIRFFVIYENKNKPCCCRLISVIRGSCGSPHLDTCCERVFISIVIRCAGEPRTEGRKEAPASCCCGPRAPENEARPAAVRPCLVSEFVQKIF